MLSSWLGVFTFAPHPEGSAPHGSVEAELSVVTASGQDGPLSSPLPSRFRGRALPVLKVNIDRLPHLPTGASQLADSLRPLVREGTRAG